MTAMEWTITIIVAIAGLAAGMALGGMPLKREKMTEQQNKIQQLAGMAACGVVVILIFMHMDVASWVAIGALAVGAGVANIPPVHRWLLERFPELAPKKPDSPLTRVKKK